MKGIFTSISLIVVLSGFVGAQPVFIKQLPENSSNFVKVGNSVFFTSGDSLLKTDGTASGTVLVESGFENPGKLFESNGLLYFLNDTITAGSPWLIRYAELWRSDGTESGTYFLGKSDIGPLEVIKSWNGFIYYAASTASTGRELYCTNGTISGTHLLKDINPGASDGIVTNFSGNYTGAGQNFYFVATNQTHGAELWKTNGSPAGTAMVKDILPGSESGVTGSLYGTNGIAYFLANDGIHGTEPWRTDGTTENTIMIEDLTSGADGSDGINFLVDYSGEVYFNKRFNSNFGGTELWKINPATFEASIVKTFGDEFSEYNIGGPLLEYNGKLYFFVRKHNLYEDLYVTDGTQDGTALIKEEVTTDGYISYFDIVNDHMVFYGDGQGYYYKFFKSDGTAEGTQVFYRFKCSDGPRALKEIGNELFFADNDGSAFYCYPDNSQDYMQLIQSGISERNTRSVRSMYGISLSGANNIIDLNGKVLFTTFNPNSDVPEEEKNKRLWLYDPMRPAETVPYFTLVDADTDEDIKWIKQGDTIYKHPGQSLNIRFNPVTSAGSVVFKLADTVRRVENEAPYALAGDFDGDYSVWEEANTGWHYVTAISFSDASGNGVAGESVSIRIYIQDDLPNRSPEVQAGPDIVVYLPADSVTLEAEVADPDGDSFRLSWHLISGPDHPTYFNNENPLTISGLIEGEYIIVAEATDINETSGYDTIKISVQRIVSNAIVFTLIDADTDNEIRSLINNDTIIYDAAEDNITIKADPFTNAKSVVIKLNGEISRVENAAPYSLKGDINNDFIPWSAEDGDYVITATSYSEVGGKGSVLEESSINIHIKRSVYSQEIVFTLINAETNQDIRQIQNGETINLSEIGTNLLNIRANSYSGTKSIVFDFNGIENYKTENVAPFALFGDESGDYSYHSFEVGTYTLKATPFNGSNGSGTAGLAYEITFNVTNPMLAENLKTYPNPAGDRLRVIFTEDKEILHHAHLTIYNAEGKEFYSGNHTNYAAGIELVLNNLQMDPGVYMLKVQTGEEVKVIRFLKR